MAEEKKKEKEYIYKIELIVTSATIRIFSVVVYITYMTFSLSLFPFFLFSFFFIPRIIDRFFRIYLPYKYNVVEELIDEIIGTRKVFLFFKIDAFKIGRKHYRTRFRLNKDCINLPQFRHLHRNQKNIYIYFA